MKKEEKQLFKALCKGKDWQEENPPIDFATPTVLGHLFFNRMQGIAYDTLKKNRQLDKVNREFRASLAAAHQQNVYKNQSYQKCVSWLCEILKPAPFPVAMLKGAYLCAHYPDGCRTSHDVDLLVLPGDVTTLGAILNRAGFQQGYLRDGNDIPATRKEIIASKMLRGETVPYIKKVNLPFMPFLEVDVNFSLDYKNGNKNTLENMLEKVCIKTEKGLSIPTLQDADFFIHLCAHLYKEATTLPWIAMQRDMTLYKYADIDRLLSEMTEERLANILCRAKELGMEKICAYAILETITLFDKKDSFARRGARAILLDDPRFCTRIFSPKDKKILYYKTADAGKRFFMASRIHDIVYDIEEEVS